MKTLMRRVSVVGGALLSVSAALAAAKPVALKLNLPAKPAFARPEIAALLTAGPLTLEVTDARKTEDPAVLGASREKGEDLYQWRSKDPVGPAVRGMAAEILGGWSVRVVPEAEFGLKLALAGFYVTEKSETFGSTYLGDVRFTATVVDRAGGVLWTGEGTGTSKRPGVDGRAAMCNEALSMAMRSALAQALASVTLETAKPAMHEPAKPSAAVPVTAAAATANAIAPETMFADLTRLKAAGVTEESLVAYVNGKTLSRPLTVDEILHWKDAGLPDAAIKAATRP